MFLVYENKLKVSKNIGYILKNKYTNIIQPKNIYIYSSVSQASTACVIRGIIRNKTIFYPKCILEEFFNFFNKKQKGIIFVVSQKEIETIVDSISDHRYEILIEKKIIKINF